MKKILTLVTCLTFFYVFGKSQSSSSIRESTRNQTNNYTITVNDKSGSIKIEAEGDIIFNDDETAIAAMSSGGYLHYKKNGKRLTAEPGNEGKIYYTFEGGEKTSTLNDDNKRFLSDAIKTMISQGVDIEGFTKRLYKNGGAAVVLKGVNATQSDDVKRRMMESLLNNYKLGSDELITIANKTATQITSDYEKGELLSQFSGKYLADKQTAFAYLDAVQSIHSDFEKANAVKKILEDSLSDETFTQVVTIVNSVNSDFEKAGILENLISHRNLSESRFVSVIAAAKNLGSDFEKANVLKTIFSQNDIPQQNFNATLASVSSISSDYEKSGVLQQLAEKKFSSEQNWISVIQAVQNIGSDFEKANTLQTIASNMPNTEKIKSVFKTAAKSITSEYEYGRLAKSVDF